MKKQNLPKKRNRLIASLYNVIAKEMNWKEVTEAEVKSIVASD